MNPSDTAESVAIHGFLNCYPRETRDYAVVPAGDMPIEADAEVVAHASFSQQGVDLYVPFSYRSPTGRHQFDLPGVYRLPDGEMFPPDYTVLVTLVTSKLRLDRDETGMANELLLRVAKSCQNIEWFVEARRDDEEQLYGFDTTFRGAEQPLVSGHPFHLTLKSRQDILTHESQAYASKLRGSFPLACFSADPGFISRNSTHEESATEQVKPALRADDSVPESFATGHVEDDEVLLPVHLWRADYLRSQSEVQVHLGDGLEYVG